MQCETTVVIFHQRSKANGPRLGETALTHSGNEVGVQTPQGKWNRTRIAQVKKCFERALSPSAAPRIRHTLFPKELTLQSGRPSNLAGFGL
jgi:hypothetical protein